ncbi:pantothenate kinase [Pseudomonas fontis]|uniref:Type III pantothenate kinase n=1 Tax=Pseudomonas fontis TaxID=2942633 RepID=A0ABT5NW20_9PSED|nr:pantothenate kinase [Pseudomonas fontis]MDD0975720.1 pantothenate kinase [Pseudomonas fontis]MDD0992380.1 pantothenate kinase [Pseudomonas fontis]
MILELDCGNSFIKWRVIRSPAGAIVSGGVVDSDQALIAAVQALQIEPPARCRLVSVRTEDETTLLADALVFAFGLVVTRASAAQALGGVTNGYVEFERLGLDRWLALLGGYHLAKRACVVIDLGTAVTSDFVSATGEHLGGFICPGMPLMRNQLRTHTRRIRYDDASAERALSSLEPGCSTVEAVERGCMLMLHGFVLTQIEQARAYWGEDFTLFITGGDASMAHQVAPWARVVPDLVFVGLAIACPLD